LRPKSFRTKCQSNISDLSLSDLLRPIYPFLIFDGTKSHICELGFKIVIVIYCLLKFRQICPYLLLLAAPAAGRLQRGFELGANPTILRHNTSVVKKYNAPNSIARFFPTLKTP
jgi:hypothetical protein